MSEEKLSFEASMLKLENIVKSLESGSAPLDKLMELFEEGLSLIKSCNAMLDTAEQKVVILSTNADGEPEEADFNAGV